MEEEEEGLLSSLGVDRELNGSMNWAKIKDHADLPSFRFPSSFTASEYPLLVFLFFTSRFFELSGDESPCFIFLFVIERDLKIKEILKLRIISSPSPIYITCICSFLLSTIRFFWIGDTFVEFHGDTETRAFARCPPPPDNYPMVVCSASNTV